MECTLRQQAETLVKQPSLLTKADELITGLQTRLARTESLISKQFQTLEARLPSQDEALKAVKTKTEDFRYWLALD